MLLACENSRFSSLFAGEDVSRNGCFRRLKCCQLRDLTKEQEKKHGKGTGHEIATG